MGGSTGETSSTKKVVSPYDLTAGDNPGNVITQVQLRGPNYQEWSRAVRGALRARRKYGFVDGTIQQPAEGSDELEDWWVVNSLVAGWIYNTIDRDLQPTVICDEIARNMWDALKQRFSVVNGSRIHQLRIDLVNCKQRGDSVMMYYGKMKKIWDELQALDQFPTCKCTGCKCTITTDLMRKKEEEVVHYFLMGLDDGVYKSVRSTILNSEPLPNLNKAYQMVIQEETLQDASRDGDARQESMAFAVQSVKSQSDRRNQTHLRNPDALCTFCNRKGHLVDTCFQRCGYPDWWGDRPKGSSKGKTSLPSSSLRAKPPGARANAVSASPPSIDNDATKPEGLNAVEWEAVLAMRQSAQSTEHEKNSGLWYQDADWSG